MIIKALVAIAVLASLVGTVVAVAVYADNYSLAALIAAWMFFAFEFYVSRGGYRPSEHLPSEHLGAPNGRQIPYNNKGAE